MSHQEQGGPGGSGQPSEEELRAALEAEMRRISVDDVLLQTIVSLINLGGRRAGLAPGTEGERDLGQVQAAIEAIQALMPVVERRGMADELGPVRDALAQLQMAFARLSAGEEPTGSPEGGDEPGRGAPGEEAAESAPSAQGERPPKGPGPGQSSGRLWVPGQ